MIRSSLNRPVPGRPRSTSAGGSLPPVAAAGTSAVMTTYGLVPASRLRADRDHATQLQARTGRDRNREFRERIKALAEERRR